MLAASVQLSHARRGTWKSVVGTNVASDALSNIASGGVTGGCLIIVGEDYGEGSSIMQERAHGFAMKSQVWLIDPRPDLEHIVDMVEHSFALSEASSTPVMFELRIRACHVYGKFPAKDNVRATYRSLTRSKHRFVTSTGSCCHRQTFCTSMRRSSSAGPPRWPSSGAA